jgi:hypothetical protein
MGCPSCWRIVNVTLPAPTSPLRLRISAYLLSWFRAPRLDADADYQAAKDWARLYSPTGREENGDVLLQFSKDHYTLVSSMLGELDKKADDLMRTTLAVFGAVLAAVSAHIVQIAQPWIWFAVFGLTALAIGVGLAAVARIPAELTTPMSPKELMQVSDLSMLPSKSQMQSVAAASYHVAVTGATILNRWKTAQLRRANRFFLAGLVLLRLSLPGNSWNLGAFRAGPEVVKPQLRASSEPSAKPLPQRVCWPGVDRDVVALELSPVLNTVPLG